MGTYFDLLCLKIGDLQGVIECVKVPGSSLNSMFYRFFGVTQTEFSLDLRSGTGSGRPT